MGGEESELTLGVQLINPWVSPATGKTVFSDSWRIFTTEDQYSFHILRGVIIRSYFFWLLLPKLGSHVEREKQDELDAIIDDSPKVSFLLSSDSRADLEFGEADTSSLILGHLVDNNIYPEVLEFLKNKKRP